MGKEFHDQYIYRHANGYVRVFRCCVWSPICCNFMCFVIFSPMLHLKPLYLNTSIFLQYVVVVSVA